LGLKWSPAVAAPQGALDSPAVRIQPCGQLALAGAGPSLVGFRGLAEVRVERVASRVAPTLPSIRFGGVTVFLNSPRIANVS
jgi:hypothetical protein